MARGLTRFLQNLTTQATGDAELLRAFAAHHDQTAFTALVQRHGPLVLGVLRRLLHDPADVDDGFQATFLVLARKAGSIGKPELLGNWLYGVAHRIAARVRLDRTKRLARERYAAELRGSSAVSEALPQELLRALDEEVNQLPTKFRVPVVLCYLEGKTNEEAARALGWPRGTVASRLARARDRLRARLTQRGFAPAVVALLTIEDAFGAEPPLAIELVTSTVRAAATFVTGATTFEISERAIALAEAAMRAMLVSKYRIVATVLLSVSLLGVSTTLGSRAAQPNAQNASTQPPAGVDMELARMRVEDARLAQMRVDAARFVYRGVRERWKQEPNMAKPEDEYQWSRRWMEAEQAANEGKVARIAAIEGHVERMKQLQETLEKLATAKAVAPYQSQAARYYYLEAQHWLKEAQGK